MPLTAVARLKTSRDEEQESVIRILKAALKQAEEGDMCAIALAGIHRSGCMGTAFSIYDKGDALLGAVARLTYELNKNMDG